MRTTASEYLPIEAAARPLPGRRATPSLELELACTLLATNGDKLPPNLAKLVAHAPASFDHETLGAIVFEVRRCKERGIPVNPIAIAENVSGAGLIVAAMDQSVVSLDCAEADAALAWERFQQRQLKTILANSLSALEADPSKTGETLETVSHALSRLELPTVGSLPEIDNAAELVADTIGLPPEVIENLLHQGLKGVLGSSSKARKTWILLDAAISVATGTPFWKWATHKGRVLYLNFEIPRAFIRSRIKRLCEAKGVSDLSGLDVWTLRGHGGALGRLLPELLTKIQAGNYVLVIIDPIYKSLGGRDENSAGDIAELCNELEQIAVKSGAAVLYAAHYSKGNQAARESIDRISGSGVWTRDADTIITLTKHKVEGAFTCDLILRNLPEQPPFVVEWKFPLMVAGDLDPDELKQAGGRKREYDAEEVWRLLSRRSLTSTEWQKLADTELGVPRRSFYTIRAELEAAKRILKSTINDKWTQIKKR